MLSESAKLKDKPILPPARFDRTAQLRLGGIMRRVPRSATAVSARIYPLHEARAAYEHFHGKRLVSKMVIAETPEDARPSDAANEGIVMTEVMNIVYRYVAVWNEPAADERRRRIRALWAADGTSCYRLAEARGYEAIEARVSDSWNKWLREGNYIFRPQPDVVCHHNVLKVNWEMVTVPDYELKSAGLSYLVLSPNGCLQHDYQFNPAANDAGELVESYATLQNASSADIRRGRTAELWSAEGEYFKETSVSYGRNAIEAETARAHDVHQSKGLVFSPAHRSHRHHNLVTFKWHLRAKDTGEVVTSGSELLVLDDWGRIRRDYQYADPI